MKNANRGRTTIGRIQLFDIKVARQGNVNFLAWRVGMTSKMTQVS